jgi:hypothetical protein
MFAVGQRVWHRTSHKSGTVLECDDDRVYLVQDNGVELDFPAGDLAASPPGETPAIKAQTRDAPAPTRTLTARDITPEHERVLANVPPRALQAIAALYERRPKAGKFSALDVATRLNVITDITAVPYRTLRDHLGRPGELGLLMGKGLADSQGKA